MHYILTLLLIQTISRLRKLLTHFNMSTYATGKLNTARKLLGVSRGLQSIGRTRFATVYYAAASVLANLPALNKIYRDNEVDTAGTPLPEVCNKCSPNKWLLEIDRGFRLLPGLSMKPV